MKLGNLNIPKTAALAPMAGIADRAFREVCVNLGAAYVVGEMASAKGLCYKSKKTAELLTVTGLEHPMAVQLFGSEPESMAEAARVAAGYSPDVIDINMGCPAHKVAGNGSGSALMKDLPLAGKIIRAVAEAVDIPVTVKIRKGWDDTLVNAVEAAILAEECGAAAVTVHGRTRAQMYSPPVDMEIIARVKRAVSIPVIGNGDVDSLDKAIEMYDATGCDLVMIGRGALGNPWIFAQIAAYVDTGIRLPEPTVRERMDMMLHQAGLACRYKGEDKAMREARTHAAWYLKGIHGAASFRREAGQLKTYDDLKYLSERVIERGRQ